MVQGLKRQMERKIENILGTYQRFHQKFENGRMVNTGEKGAQYICFKSKRDETMWVRYKVEVWNKYTIEHCSPKLLGHSFIGNMKSFTDDSFTSWKLRKDGSWR